MLLILSFFCLCYLNSYEMCVSVFFFFLFLILQGKASSALNPVFVYEKNSCEKNVLLVKKNSAGEKLLLIWYSYWTLLHPLCDEKEIFITLFNVLIFISFYTLVYSILITGSSGTFLHSELRE